jgi:hypothetical protein
MKTGVLDKPIPYMAAGRIRKTEIDLSKFHADRLATASTTKLARHV